MYLDMSEAFDKIFDNWTDDRPIEMQLDIHEVFIKALSLQVERCSDPVRLQEYEMSLFVERSFRIYLLGRLHGEGGRGRQKPHLEVVAGGLNTRGK